MSSSSAPAHFLPNLEPNQVQWGKYMIQVYVGQKGPEPLGTVVFNEIEEKAKDKLKDYPGAFLYAGGSAGTCATEHANTSYLRSLRIIPRMLKPTNTRSLSTTLFGFRYPSPILLAPIGVQGTFYAEGELAPARAAGKLGVPFVCSTASTRTIEHVARANDEFAKIVPSEKGDGSPDPTKGAVWNLSLINKQSEGALAPRWYQLYWPIHDSVTSSLLSRAKASGYTTLVITLDTMTLGWRPHDLERSYLPFGLGVGIEIGRSDPVFMALHNRKPTADYEPPFPYLPSDILAMARGLKGTEQEQAKAKEDAFVGQAWLAESNSGTYRGWDDLDFILKEWEGPVVLKGIQSVRDAEKAVEVLMKDGREGGIIVSNHGGRQVDGAIPSILALQRILSSKKVQEARNPLPGSNKKKFHVLFDSGIRTGSDILKAVMLGADAVLIGRPYVYASILGGQAGVEQVIQHLLADLEITMGLSGWDSLDEVRGKGLKSVLASVKGDMKGEMVGVDDGEEVEILIKVDC
ncbi:FMN-dependent alpha-hydroxy acid dehydrogenase [Dendrothele bispora CBS 962.96]|uniref:FMN-dependent alpha-hydroxy acid dehydrogenase n=1 Tax=Dendrothele bispora (strain CBS 962.96) TaxID=1314807 RepID=A0A4S8L333_DENBC|nr:FMN-dependent alpha-hydroxy acid dehydrogenase [Dendrothele bispora CBS 962.96]